MLIKILLLFISLLLYIYSPLNYDESICIWCMVLFFVQCYLILKDDFKNKNFITFNSIFLFSFFWVSFAYPVFIHGTVNAYLGEVSQHINWDVLSKVTCLALVFVNCYSIGYSRCKNKCNLPEFRNIIEGSEQEVHIGFLLSFVLVLLNVAYSLITQGIDNAGIETNYFVFDIFNVFLVLEYFVVSRKTGDNITTKVFLKSNKFVITISVVFILLFLVLGDRGPLIRVALISLFFYSLKTKVGLKKLIIAVVAASFVMFFVRQTRNYQSVSLIRNGFSALSLNSDLFNFGESGLIVMFSDLYGIERELCAGYDYVMNYGYVHPEKIMIVPTYAVPFLPTLILGLFGLTTDDFSMGAVLNRYLADYTPHFGNHIVIDIYMCVGVWGVIVFAYLLGVLSGSLFKKRQQNLYYLVCYVLFFSLSVYLPRDSVFSLIRPLTLSVIIIYLLKNNSISIKKKVRNGV